MRERIGRMLPKEWMPPMPFPMRVAYRVPGRPPEVLWTMPQLWQQDGDETPAYAAYGPAGRPASGTLLAAVDLREMPENARVYVATALDEYGRSVYSQPPHTLN